MRKRATALSGALLALLLACAGPVDESPSAIPRPPLPERWRTVTNDEGTVEIGVPFEMSVTTTDRRIIGVLADVSGQPVLFFAVVPSNDIRQPASGEEMVEWLTAEGFWPGSAEGDDPHAIELGTVTERDVRLPAGPAHEVFVPLRFANEGVDG